MSAQTGEGFGERLRGNVKDTEAARAYWSRMAELIVPGLLSSTGHPLHAAQVREALARAESQLDDTAKRSGGVIKWLGVVPVLHGYDVAAGIGRPGANEPPFRVDSLPLEGFVRD